ncbi:serine hydrolase [Saccharopolyspora cebuensis]|uniref:Beta-lactamase n=1 Tax=Saccharopolyspora cebuensis TaxID=418759 RepID=A0ABV4CI93_9PSEU
MSFSRRHLLATAGAAAPLLLLAPSAAARPSPPDLATPDGWVAWFRAHRGGVGLFLDDGRGNRLVHRPHAAQPLASAIKVVHLLGYAVAVERGELDPREQIRLGDWERYYVPLDGGAHPAALRHLDIPTDDTGLHAADPDHRVALDDAVAAMIRFSDSAVPDLLRDRLGVRALRRAAAAGGWPDPDLRSMCAEYLFLLPEHAPPAHLPLPARRARGFALERRYRDDPALRRRVLDRLLTTPLPSWDEQRAWGDRTMGAPARPLAALHRATATGAIPGAALARTHLERPRAGALPPGVDGIGYKGGSLPGVLTAGLTVRRADGSTGSGALLAHGDITPEQLTTADPGGAVLVALQDPAYRDRLAAALRG